MTLRYGPIAIDQAEWKLSDVYSVLNKAQWTVQISSPLVQVQAQKKRQQQQELIAELRKRQAKDHRPVYEGKDGTIEDIITGGPDSTLRRARVGASSPGRRRPRTTVVIHCSAPLKCTLCYVVQTQAHLEHST